VFYLVFFLYWVFRDTKCEPEQKEAVTGLIAEDSQGGLKDIPLLMRYNQDAIVGDDADELTYESLPVSKFGEMMLKNMGWYKGRGIGKNPE